ncbi:hypothetical protein WJX81_005986 [Elliptochloris bilobata]|uniref:Uncharacterized protein n=1 Tax=Elliptochloris bilobata TaxID=381761 RepID=A0AAW1RZ72_9CHLO
MLPESKETDQPSGLALLAGLLMASLSQGEAQVLQAVAPASAPLGAQAPAAAQAAGPTAVADQATITNIVEARTGTMANATHLLLGGVDPKVAWVLADSGSGGRATGRYFVSDFVGANFAKDGSWLGSPEAVVHATDKASGNDTTLVLVLSGPVYNTSAGTLAFSVAPAAAGSKKAKLAGGAAESAIAHSQAVGLQQPAAGLQLTDVSMFIDDSDPPPDASGAKATFAPLGQNANNRNFQRGGSRFAPLDSDGGGGLVHAGSAYYGWFYPFVPRDCWNTAACSAGTRG